MKTRENKRKNEHLKAKKTQLKFLKKVLDIAIML